MALVATWPFSPHWSFQRTAKVCIQPIREARESDPANINMEAVLEGDVSSRTASSSPRVVVTQRGEATKPNDQPWSGYHCLASEAEHRAPTRCRRKPILSNKNLHKTQVNGGNPASGHLPAGG